MRLVDGQTDNDSVAQLLSCSVEVVAVSVTAVRQIESSFVCRIAYSYASDKHKLPVMG